jgi:hypothetical protein
MPSLPHVCQLAASGLRTADTDFSGWPTATTRDGKGGYQGGRLRKGKISTDTLDVTAQLASWPTPVANDDNKSVEAHLAMKRRMGERDGTFANRTAITSLQVMAKTAWPTPVVMDANSSARHGYMIKGHAGTTMLDAARLAGWPTTRASDGEKNVRTLEGSMREIERKGSPQDLAQAGAIAIGSPAGTTNTGQLNPAHSRWLMGYPVAWDDCAPTVTPSSRKSPPRS